jgi:hypothetical protein
LAQRSQRFGLRSNHGNHPEFVSFSFGGIMRQTLSSPPYFEAM